NDVNIEGRNSSWPYYTIIIMVLFNYSCYYSRYTNSITAHYHRLIFTILIKEVGSHCFTILCSKLEYVTNFDTFFKLNCTNTIRGWITWLDIPQISVAFYLKVTTWINMNIMFVNFIATAHTIDYRFNSIICYNFHFFWCIYWSKKTRYCFHPFFCFLLRSQLNDSCLK
ncbi:hypothetical protein AOA60_00935, partial [Pseudomonas sp. 2822-17]